MHLESELILTKKISITSADVDMFNRLRISALLNIFIQSAISSADKLGFGFTNLNAQKLFWVLSRMTIEIYKPLKWYEKATVETWPKSIEGLLYTRDFIVYDSNGILVAKATSGWLAIDIESKKPKIIDGLQAEMLVQLKDKSALHYTPEKLSGITEGESFHIKSSYYDIDLNRHVTSTRYIDWIMDTFEPEFHKNHYAKKISINFMKETMPGDSISLVRQNTDHLDFKFEGTNVSNSKTSFRANVSF